MAVSSRLFRLDFCMVFQGHHTREKGHSYVSLSDLETVGGAHRVQVWAGADDGIRFGRYLVREFSSLLGGQRDAIVKSLEEAADRATALPDVTLTETYIRPAR